MTVFLLRIVFLPILIAKVLIKKPILILFVFIAFSVITYWQSCTASRPRVVLPEYQLNAPTSTQASKVFSTSSRLYYAVDYNTIEKDSHWLLSEFYVYEDNSWILKTKPLPLNENIYGEIRVYENTNN